MNTGPGPIRLRAALCRLLPALLLLVMALAAAPAADAASLNDYRKAGVIGERYDGYVVVRKPSPAVNKFAAAVNEKRRRIYAAQAGKQHVSAAAVGEVYARQIWRSAPSGTYLLNKQGQWVRKP